MSLERKIKRNKKKIEKKAEKKMAAQLGMFDRIPDQCIACKELFDKKSKEHAMTWKVVVFNAKKEVHLICPKCQRKK
tara:strand:+ start:3528 stop:3758 length:231 start_codon:yes stop_codon:yes gene_type:complete